MLKYVKRTRGFTLLELIVVIVILGLLAAIAIPTFNTATNKASDATVAATLAAMLKDTGAISGVSGRTVFKGDDYRTAVSETSIATGGYTLTIGTPVQGSWARNETTGAKTKYVSAMFYMNNIASTDETGNRIDTAVVGEKTGNCIFGRLVGNTVKTWIVGRSLGSNCSGASLETAVPNAGGGGGNNGGNNVFPETALPYAAPDTTAPTAVNVSIGASSLTSVVVNWTASTDLSGISKYIVKYTPAANASATPVEVILGSDARTTTLTGLTYATSYNVSVEAYDNWGNKSTATQTASTTNTVSDNFTRSGALGNTTVGNIPWQTLSGSWSTNGNLAVAASSPAAAVVETGVSNATVQVSTSTSSSAGDEALVLRASSNGDMLRARTERSSSTSTSSYGAYYASGSPGYYYCTTGTLTRTSDGFLVCQSAAGSWFQPSYQNGSSSYYYCSGSDSLNGTTCTSTRTTYQTMLILESISGGTPTNIGSTVLGSSTPSYIKATLNGDQVNVFTNLNAGTPAISATSSFNQSATLFGIGRATGSQSGFQVSGLDNFLVTL